MMKRKKVLMLGWEFPPLINGGLGVACYGISKALSKHLDLTIVLPKTSPDDQQIPHVKLIGLNHLNASEVFHEELQFEKSRKEQLDQEIKGIVEATVDPYYQYSTTTKTDAQKISKEIEHISKDVISLEDISPDFLEVFKSKEVYGEDVIQKVILYAKYAEKLSKSIDFDVIYAHDWMTFLAGVAIKQITGKPLVVHVHALDYDRVGSHSRGWIYDVEKYGMQNADRVIPVSKYTAEVITTHYGIDASKIYPVHNGAIEVESFKEVKKIPEKLVLFLGRVTHQKGPENFMEIASKVFEAYPKVRFVVAGTGDKLKRLIEKGAYRNIGHKFHFTGFLDKDKVNRLLSMTDVYCMPSVSEPFGLSALEAAQFGIPTVLSKQSGVSEVLEGALTADFWDVNLMAEHIVSLLESKKLANQLVAKNKKNLQYLTWDHSAEKILDVFQSLEESVAVYS